MTIRETLMTIFPTKGEHLERAQTSWSAPISPKGNHQCSHMISWKYLCKSQAHKESKCQEGHPSEYYCALRLLNFGVLMGFMLSKVLGLSHPFNTCTYSFIEYIKPSCHIQGSSYNMTWWVIVLTFKRKPLGSCQIHENCGDCLYQR